MLQEHGARDEASVSRMFVVFRMLRKRALRLTIEGIRSQLALASYAAPWPAGLQGTTPGLSLAKGIDAPRSEL